jgi:2,3-diphosphopglycerate-independent phosphoglycerate mutase
MFNEMKHIIILGDGMADWPVKSLGDKTLLQYAKTPYMDMLARMGRNGRLQTVADGFHPGSEVANLSVLGYNLPKVYEGRGALEAASIGIDLKPGEMAMRCNLICIDGEVIKTTLPVIFRRKRLMCLFNICRRSWGVTRCAFIPESLTGIYWLSKAEISS